MPECSHIDSLVTPFVDGELPTGEQQRVTEHIAACPPCRAKVAAESAVRTLVRACRTELSPTAAPSELKARCSLLRHSLRPAGSITPFSTDKRAVKVPPAATWRTRLAPFALAATLVF